MTRSLPPRPSIESLKNQAKQLLKKYNSGDAEAVTGVQTFFPDPGNFKTLRDAQLTIARTYGLAGWKDLKAAVQKALDSQHKNRRLEFDAMSFQQKADFFTQLACVQYSEGDLAERYGRAQRLIQQEPGLSGHSIYAAIVANDLKQVKRLLASNPDLATTAGGPLNWPPLLYLTYGRIQDDPGESSAIQIARLLLSHGADANSFVLLNESYSFTALTGAMGEGEAGPINQPPHQYAKELVELLLDAGADPAEGQGLYNTIFTASGDTWLSLFIDRGLDAQGRINWNDANHDPSRTIFNFLLAYAVDSGNLQRVEFLLAHGADANTVNGYNGRPVHANATIKGQTEIAACLQQAGAEVKPMTRPDDKLHMACRAADKDAITRLIQDHPDLVKNAARIQEIAEFCDLQTMNQLLDLGFDINDQNEHGRTLLHHMATNGALDKVKALIERGARTDIRDTHHNGTAVGWANAGKAWEVRNWLLDRSENIYDLVIYSRLKRVRSLLAEQPGLATSVLADGSIAIHHVGYGVTQGDEMNLATIEAMVEVLLEYKADINLQNDRGETPLDHAIVRDIPEIISILEQRGAVRGT